LRPGKAGCFGIGRALHGVHKIYQIRPARVGFSDFPYVDDLVRAIRLLIDAVPERPIDGVVPQGDSLSHLVPFRNVNIGNSDNVRLLDFVDAIEDCLGKKAIRNYMPMKMGDVPATWANAGLL
jgi:UDP-glucuronate 4-epimerase